MRPTELAPQLLIDHLLLAYRKNPEWVVWKWGGQKGHYQASIAAGSTITMLLKQLGSTGADLFALKALSHWLGGGPKTFIPTEQQCLALEHVSVNLPLTDYTQPYPAMCVKLPPRYAPFIAVLCFHDYNGGPAPMLSCVMHTKDHMDDVTTTVGMTGEDIEQSLVKFDPDCANIQEIAPKALRVAVNSCLALTNFGCHLSYLYPHEAERDLRLGQEQTPRGARARERAALIPQRVAFNQDIQLHADERHVDREPGEPTGREMPFGWRRGHWAMQPCGVNWSERKRIFRRPCMVRKDKLTGDQGGTSTTYHG